MAKKVLILSYTDEGGAGIANVEIAKAMIAQRFEVQMVVAKKTLQTSFIKEAKKAETKRTITMRLHDRITLELKKIVSNTQKDAISYVEKYCYYNDNEEISAFNFNEVVNEVTFKPDIVIGAWLSHFINLDTLGKIGKHYNAHVFTLMNDMAHLTGGCHYSWGCLGYMNDCSNCPAISGPLSIGNSKKNLKLKQDAINKYNIQVIAGSKENITEARNSRLYKNQNSIKVINGILDFKIFNPDKRNIAKQVFDIPMSQKMLLCGASNIADPRKGFDKLMPLLQHLNDKLKNNNQHICVFVIGRQNYLEFDFSNIIVHKLDLITDKLLLSLLYQAADVYMSLSIEDTGPAMVVQSLGCGTPVVGFNIGFVRDLVEDSQNGYIIYNHDVVGFAEKVYELMYHKNAEQLRVNAKQSVYEKFSSKQFNNAFFN